MSLYSSSVVNRDDRCLYTVHVLWVVDRDDRCHYTVPVLWIVMTDVFI
jgi:hypothetical protein